MDEHIVVIVVAACLLGWVIYQIVKTDIPSYETKDNSGSSGDSSPNQPVKNTKSRKNTYSYYLSKPKNQISFLTLLAVLGYTWLTQQEVSAAQNQVMASNTANGISQNALTAETRAWIDFTVDKVALDWSNPTTPSMIAYVTFTNEGNSPALNVSLDLDFVEGYPPVNHKRVQEICSASRPKDFGNTLFMKNHFSTSASVISTWSDIESFKASIAKLNNTSPDKIPFYDPVLVVCADYRIIGDDQWHYTGRAFAVGVWGKTKSGQLNFGGMPIGMSLPFGVAGLNEEYDGDYTD